MKRDYYDTMKSFEERKTVVLEEMLKMKKEQWEIEKRITLERWEIEKQKLMKQINN